MCKIVFSKTLDLDVEDLSLLLILCNSRISELRVRLTDCSLSDVPQFKTELDSLILLRDKLWK